MSEDLESEVIRKQEGACRYVLGSNRDNGKVGIVMRNSTCGLDSNSSE